MKAKVGNPVTATTNNHRHHPLAKDIEIHGHVFEDGGVFPVPAIILRDSPFSCQKHEIARRVDNTPNVGHEPGDVLGLFGCLTILEKPFINGSLLTRWK
jgi:hypothetical protein